MFAKFVTIHTLKLRFFFYLEGCASIACFKKLLGKIVKTVTLDSVDENEDDDIVGKSTTEAA